MSSEALDHLAQSAEGAVIAKTATYGGASTAIIFGMEASEFGVWAGLLIAVIGLAYNMWATERRLNILRGQHEDEGE